MGWLLPDEPGVIPEEVWQKIPVQERKPKIVVLCGSSRFVDIMAVCAWLIERDEHAIAMGLHLLPAWYPDCPDDHLAEAEGVAGEMDALHLKKIDLADEVFIVNYNDYMGDSTISEYRYARSHGKKIRWFTHDEIGEKVSKMIERTEPDEAEAYAWAHQALRNCNAERHRKEQCLDLVAVAVRAAWTAGRSAQGGRIGKQHEMDQG